ncbi:MAG TPA: hypothetical protein PLI90_00385 [Rhodocyclaceae bacterium]|mgnify:CR=1 FL=1|nr:hypothetical protein [Rhodocyclaceae bacterium]
MEKFQSLPFLPYFLILLVALLACAPLLKYGAIGGHDLGFHLIWVKHFTAQLAQGELYPRWLMDMNFGAGSPTFYYYAPLAYYTAAIPGLLLPWIELATQHAIGETLIIALSGLTFYHYAHRRFAAIPALFAALVYMLLPYHYEIDLWTRQDLSELANYIWLPLVLDYTERLFDGEKAMIGLAISYGGMMLTHLPTALLFSLGLAGYVLMLAYQKPSWRLSVQLSARFSIAITIGILLAGIYWIPAVFCQKYIHAEEWWSPRNDFHIWFFPHPDIAHNDMYAAIFTSRLFDVLRLTTMIFTLCWLSTLRWRTQDVMKKLWPCLALVVISWFFMSSWSRILWETLPLLSKAQFPWRIAIVLDLATAIAVLLMMNTFYLQRDKLTALIAIAVVGFLLYSLTTIDVRFMPVPGDSGADARRLSRENIIRESVDAPAHMPRWWNPAQAEKNDKTIETLGKISYDEHNGSIVVAAWVPRRISFDVDLKKSTTLTVRQFYFPNWRASIVGSGSTLKIVPVAGWGLIRISAPAGKYQLRLELLPLKQETLGKAASGFAVMLLLGRAVWLYRRKRTLRIPKNCSQTVSGLQ